MHSLEENLEGYAHRRVQIDTVSVAMCVSALETSSYSVGQGHGCPQSYSIDSPVSEMNKGNNIFLYLPLQHAK
jgi:hypothetical protein